MEGLKLLPTDAFAKASTTIMEMECATQGAYRKDTIVEIAIIQKPEYFTIDVGGMCDSQTHPHSQYVSFTNV
jgi:hypothetical protein